MSLVIRNSKREDLPGFRIAGTVEEECDMENNCLKKPTSYSIDSFLF